MTLPEVKTILYATSLGDHTRPVFRQAVKLASLYRARIVMLHVVEPVGEMGRALIENYLSEGLIREMHDEGIDNIKQTMKERVTRFYEEELRGISGGTALSLGISLNVEQVVAEGNHADAIIDIAGQVDADLIVMGTHNQLGRSSGTTRVVIKYSGRPVLAIPTKG